MATNYTPIKGNIRAIQDRVIVKNMYFGEQKTKGGIIFSQESLDKSRIATNCGYVIKMGPLAYKDKDKFPEGPWCKEKDWVIFARYAGSRLPIEGGEVRLLNDDEVLGTIKDPESVLHYI